jgi:hypothetical protein
MPKEQSAQSHAAWDPIFHFFLMPLFLANLIYAVVQTVRAWPRDSYGHLWSVVIAVALIVLCARLRIYGLANQDRIIRLEERVRIAALVPRADAHKLTTGQLIALRFASDAELPALVSRTLAENLDPKSIKQSITAWRPDYQRI